MNASAKYQANWTETVGVVWTRFCRQTDRWADSSILPTNFVCRGINRKHCGKRRNRSLKAISPFPKVFSEDLYHRHITRGA